MRFETSWECLSTPLEEMASRKALGHPRGESVRENRTHPRPSTPLDHASILDRVAGKIAPLCLLRGQVAVNPYQGFVDQDWLQARQQLLNHSGGDILMPLAHYRRVWSQGGISKSDIDSAADEFLRDGVPFATDLDYEQIEAELASAEGTEASPGAPSRHRPRFETLTAIADRYLGGDWSRVVREEIGRHCAVHYDEGQAAWPSPWTHLTLYHAWRLAAARDYRLTILGLRGFGRLVRSLPDSADLAIERLLERLRVPLANRESFLLAQAFSVLGWSSWTRYRDQGARWRDDGGSDFTDLLAMRLAYDVAVAERHELSVAWSAGCSEASVATQPEATGERREVAVRNCLLRASEIAYRRGLLGDLLNGARENRGRGSEPEPATDRKLAKIVFCMDLRSERYRRALESCAAEIETSGFAGFFGMPIEYLKWGEVAGCGHDLELIERTLRVEELPFGGALPNGNGGGVPDGNERLLAQGRVRKVVKSAWRATQSPLFGGFGFVETMRRPYGWRWLQSSWSSMATRFGGLRRAPLTGRQAAQPTLDGLAGQGVDFDRLAESGFTLLCNLGIRKRFPRLVVFCAHGSDSANNPLKGRLDGGAGCDQLGAPNPRFAAMVLNHPDVRRLIADRGIQIPEDVQFVAAVHNKTTETVELLESAEFPESHATDLRRLRERLQTASALAHADGSPALPSPRRGEARLGADCFNVRPEWGLAGNAAMVIAPRSATQGVDLGGRVFLHCYDQSEDANGEVLRGILVAPMAVAHRINMQHYASVVDPERFGSGSQAANHWVGRFGVFSGKSGALRTGWPTQSVRDGTRRRHEPLRLQVVIAAARTRIDKIIRTESLLHDLVANGWIYLIAWEQGRFFRCTRNLGWLPVHVEVRADGSPTTTPGNTKR